MTRQLEANARPTVMAGRATEAIAARVSRARTGLLHLLALGLAACSEPAGPAPGPITELPRALSSAEQEVLARSNAFAFALAGQLIPKAADENLFYSPISASMVLGMLLNGADGRTYEQMRSVLAFQNLTQEQINQAYSDLTDLLLTLDPSVTIELGNSVWSRQGFPVQPDFLTRVRTSFDAEAQTVDFGDPATLPRINRWASDATHGRIDEIFKELPAGVVMVLLNAIYFKASWTAQFDKARTERAPFTRPDGSSVTADLMYLDAEVPAFHGATFSMVELPYGGSAFSMVVLAPAPGLSADAMLSGLNVEGWEARLGALTPSRNIVRLPRFELEWEKKLNEPLQALGMTDAFDSGRADFRRLTPGGGVWLDLVKQKSFVKVDEEGTEAAAVTGAVVVESAPPEVRLDRPFIFVIRERLTGAILFLGLLNDPTT
jgi:serpin B